MTFIFEPMHKTGTYDPAPPPHTPGRRANTTVPYDVSKSTANRLQPAHLTGRHALPFVWTPEEIRQQREYHYFPREPWKRYMGKHVKTFDWRKSLGIEG